MTDIQKGGLWKHLKSGKIYQIIDACCRYREEEEWVTVVLYAPIEAPPDGMKHFTRQIDDFLTNFKELKECPFS